MPMTKNIEISIPGFLIAGKSWGHPENPPILALHGWLDNGNSFDQIAELLQNNYHFIAIDLPGHGHSSHLPPGSNYHFIDGIFTIIQIIDALNLKKVHLLGHSLGACLGSIVAGVAPDRISTLSLIEGLGPLTHPEDTACKQLTQYLSFIQEPRLKNVKGYPDFEMAALARSKKGYVSLEIARSLCQRGLVEKKNHFYWRHDSRLLVPSPLQMTEEQVMSCLQQIEAQTCLFWASNGFSYNYELMQKRIRSVKNLTIERLEGGHHVHMEQPEAIAALLVAFYQKFIF